MNILIKNTSLIELSKQEVKNIQGGSPLTYQIFKAIGWFNTAFNSNYEAGAAGAEYGPKY